jgi:hypothetical protein
MNLLVGLKIQVQNFKKKNLRHFKELVMMQDYSHNTTLHLVCTVDAPVASILKMINFGGNDSLILQDSDNDTALYLACIGNVSIEVILKMNNLLMLENNRSENACNSPVYTMLQLRLYTR